jgi:hypothetical protein
MPRANILGSGMGAATERSGSSARLFQPYSRAGRKLPSKRYTALRSRIVAAPNPAAVARARPTAGRSAFGRRPRSIAANASRMGKSSTDVNLDASAPVVAATASANALALGRRHSRHTPYTAASVKKAVATSLVICLPCARTLGLKTQAPSASIRAGSPYSSPAQRPASQASRSAKAMVGARTIIRRHSLRCRMSTLQPAVKHGSAFSASTGIRCPFMGAPGPWVRKRKP